MISAKITSKGQITIPKEIRSALRLSEGDEIMFFDLGHRQFAFRPRTGSIRDLKGIVPKLDYVPTIEELDEGIAAAVEEDLLASVSPDPADQSKDEAA